MLSIIKFFEFSASHRLAGHPGMCKHSHGHNFKVRLKVRRPEFEIIGDRTTPMIVEFKDLKYLLNPIIEALDHSHMCVLHPEGLEAMNVQPQRWWNFKYCLHTLSVWYDADTRTWVFSVDPTMEVVAGFLFHAFAEELGRKGLLLQEVEIMETDRSGICLTRDDV